MDGKGDLAPETADARPGELFSPVNIGRVSEVIVQQVRALIREGKLRPGDRLPSERDLCTRFGVSRVTVREALRVLEASGLVSIRVGARGGAFVTSPTSERVGEGLADLLTLSPLSASEVTEARMVVELGIIPLVVKRATEEDLADLTAICEKQRKSLEDEPYDMALSAEFHIRVAACAHNAAIEMLVGSFHGPLLMSLEDAHVRAPLMGHRGNKEHLALVRAIGRRDEDAAATIMRRHLQRTANRVAETADQPPADS